MTAERDYAGQPQGGPKARARRPWRLQGLAMVALALLAQGCREEEQNRPLVHQKGTYQGPADQKLDQDQLDALRQRAARQQM